MFEGEMFMNFVVIGVILVIYLLIGNLDNVIVDFIFVYGEICFVVVVYCVSWFD